MPASLLNSISQLSKHFIDLEKFRFKNTFFVAPLRAPNGLEALKLKFVTLSLLILKIFLFALLVYLVAKMFIFLDFHDA